MDSLGKKSSTRFASRLLKTRSWGHVNFGSFSTMASAYICGLWCRTKWTLVQQGKLKPNYLKYPTEAEEIQEWVPSTSTCNELRSLFRVASVGRSILTLFRFSFGGRKFDRVRLHKHLAGLKLGNDLSIWNLQDQLLSYSVLVV